MIDLVLAGLVLLAMAALGAVDARYMIVDPRLVLALVGAGLLWRLFGSVESGSLWGAALGAVLGVAVVAVPIAIAQWRGRPWPLFPGDAMLLAGLGFVLGPLGLGWSMLAGSALALAHRVWLQRRRGRSIVRGYCPLGPGMAAGAMAVFVFINAGGALAADDATGPMPPTRPDLHERGAPQPPPLRPDPTQTVQSVLAATELAPVRTPLPAGLAGKAVAIHERAALPFAEATRRIATLAGVPVEVEERPARVAGGAVALPDAPDVRLAFQGRLPALLDRVAARSGYGWTWEDGAILFYRYWDREQRPPGAEAGIGADEPMAAGLEDTTARWRVERVRHETLRDVLEDWAARAGWRVVWKPARRYAVGADAAFVGDFLDAVDGLLAGPATRRSLAALAHVPNRHLVIEDRGTPWSKGTPWSAGTLR